jgi:hypothetical protein
MLLAEQMRDWIASLERANKAATKRRRRKMSTFGVLLKPGLTIVTTLSYSTHIYRVDTPILDTTCQVFDRTAADAKGEEGCCIDGAT